MKNPIREWIARIAREEIYKERRERNLETIKAEINRPFVSRLSAQDFSKRRPEDKFTIGGLS